MFIMSRQSKRSSVLAAAAAVGIAGLCQSAMAGQIIVNFGNSFTGTDALGRHYDSITSISNGPFALNTTTGTSSGYQLTVTNPPGTAFTNSPTGPAYTNGFNTFNFAGTTAPTGMAANYSGSVTSASAYGNSNYQNNGTSNNYVPEVLLTLSGLDPAETYGFDFFASRMGANGDHRITDYTVTGGSAGTAATTLSLDASENTGNVVAASGFTPNTSGDITVLVDADSANTNANKFYYLSVLQINSSGTGSSGLTYTGSVNGNFDTSTTNFQSGGTAVAFANTDSVVFDDTATGTHNVTVASGGVSPSSVSFNNVTTSYNLSGGAITGSGKLTVSGGGTVFLNNPNTFAGGTTVSAGSTLIVGGSGSIGGSLSVSGTFALNGSNASVSTLNSAGGLFSFQVGASSVNSLTASAITLSGTTMVTLGNASGSSLTPGTTYPLLTATSGGITGPVIFNGRENLTVPGNVAIQNIGGTNYRLTLGETNSQVTVTAALAPTHTISIMPLGSSSTAGFSAQSPYNGGGYRSQLYQSLVDDGRFNPQFVGSSVTTASNNGTAPDLMTVVGQTHHEGHGGYVTNDVIGNLNANAGTGDNDGGYWLKPGNGVNPDYITLNIGSNDYAYNANATGVINNLDNIVNQIFTLRPSATIVLSNIFYRGDNPAGSLAAQTNYNALMPALVYKYTLAGKHISFLDLYTALTPNDSLANIGPDLIHPTQAGYDVEANAWYNAITQNQAFYTGAQGSAWNSTGSGGSTSWAMDYQRSTDALIVPSAVTDVYFNGVGGNVTLASNTSARGVNFAANLGGGSAPAVTVGGSNSLTLGVGGITVQAGTGINSISAPVVLGASQVWSNVSTNPFTVSGTISGNSPLAIGGTGVIVLSGSNSFTGQTNLSGGTLNLSNSNALQASILNISGGSLAFDQSVTSNAFTVAGLTGNGPIALVNNASAPAAIALTTGANNANSAYSGQLSGSGSLIKVGNGTLSLLGASSYSGNTQVQGGTLFVNNAHGLGNGAGSAVLSNGTTLSLGLASSQVGFSGFTHSSNGVYSPVVSADGSSVVMTTSTNSEATSIFTPTPVTISDLGGFTASFTYTHANIGTQGAGADGITFDFQNQSNTALGGSGGSLGYSLGTGTNTAGVAISPGVAVVVDDFKDCVGTGQNGVLTENSGTAPGISNTSTSTVTVVYSGTSQTLVETLMNSQGTYTATLTNFDLATQLGESGGNAAGYIGFTGSTGGVNDTQTISNFSFSGSSSVAISNAVTVAANASSVLQLSPTVTYSSGGVGPVTIASGGKLAVSIGSSPATAVTKGVLTATSVKLSNSSSGTMDMATNGLDLTGQSLSAVTALVASAFAGGTWTGPGITSSTAANDSTHLTALGVISNALPGGTQLYGTGTALGLFDGDNPGESDILVQYTYSGDANLDGQVDGSDYTRIDNGYLNLLTGWFNGDFNYDGVVDGSDYTLIDNAFNAQGARLASEVANPLAIATDQIAGSTVSAVPEPTSLALLGIGACGLLRRRCRYR